MDTSLVEALVRSQKLTMEAVRGPVLVVAATSPGRLADLADRDDLDVQTRAELLRAASPWDVVGMLDRWHAAVELVELAVSAHGPSAELVAYCGAQGWLAKSVELAATLRPGEATSVPHRWERQVGCAIPDEVRLALLDAVIVPHSPVPGFASMTEWEQRDVMKRLEREEETENQRVWDLLEPAPHLWSALARDGRHPAVVRGVLLDCPPELPDDVLLACLPTVTNDRLRPADPARRNDWHGQVRLSLAATHARRRPRLRAIAAGALRRVVREAAEDVWTPHDRFLGADWSGIANLAVLTDDETLLADAAAAAGSTPPRSFEIAGYRRADKPDPFAERAEALLALAANEATPRAALVALVPTLDERTLGLLLERGDGELAEACRAQIDRLRREADARRPTLAAVPGDDELAQAADPAAVLRGHLRYLRGAAAQRDLTSGGLLRSRYTTPEIFHALPARHVLRCAERAEQVADMIVETCDGELDRWRALAARANVQPPLSMTFGTWLGQLTAAT